MTVAWFISGIVLLWYCSKAMSTNPNKPNWHKAIAAAAFWPFSLFIKRFRRF